MAKVSRSVLKYQCYHEVELDLVLPNASMLTNHTKTVNIVYYN